MLITEDDDNTSEFGFDPETERLLLTFDTLNINAEDESSIPSYPERVLDHLFSQLTASETTRFAPYGDFLKSKGTETRKTMLECLRPEVHHLLSNIQDVSIDG
jgi:hypothetical protein